MAAPGVNAPGFESVHRLWSKRVGSRRSSVGVARHGAIIGTMTAELERPGGKEVS
jgi:hypothetical protein